MTVLAGQVELWGPNLTQKNFSLQKLTVDSVRLPQPHRGGANIKEIRSIFMPIYAYLLHILNQLISHNYNK